jgi:peptidoglycan hydrolase-like protein with peptidoglycan-binding domain
VRLSIPAGSAGVHASDGGRLSTGYLTSFRVGGPSSVLRLQQLLAELGYLPLRFNLSARRRASALASEPRSLDLISLTPLPGSFTWRYRRIPHSLAGVWRSGRAATMLRGAVMAFEADHHLPADGLPGRALWIALLETVAAHRLHKAPYDYIEVSRSMPETLRVWQAGRVIFRSLTNTGISSRPTAAGTFPVYERFRSTTMSGTNPDGSHYSDAGVPYVAYFNGGDAVHGFLRPGYGYAQSLGCVELPYSAAAVVFRYDPIGTLVTVS